MEKRLWESTPHTIHIMVITPLFSKPLHRTTNIDVPDILYIAKHCANQASFSYVASRLTFGCVIAADNDADNRCLSAWRLTDPREDKDRILNSKDPLLEGSCSWILHDPAFTQWWNNDESRILWIHGDPGKGKTMII